MFAVEFLADRRLAGLHFAFFCCHCRLVKLGNSLPVPVSQQPFAGDTLVMQNLGYFQLQVNQFE